MAFVPLLTVAASRKWHVLRRPNFWLIPVIVVLVAGPWYLAQREMVQYASEPVPERHLVGPAAVANLIDDRQAGRAAGCASHPGWDLRSVWFAPDRPPSGRRSLPSVSRSGCSTPSCIRSLLAVSHRVLRGLGGLRRCGCQMVHRTICRDQVAPRCACTARGLGAVLVAAIAWGVPAQPTRHFADVTGRVLQLGLHPTSTALVSSDRIGEGAFIATMAARNLHPRPTVLRATKTLAEGTWMGLDYSERFHDERALAEWLDRARVDYVVVDDASTEPHHQRLGTFRWGARARGTSNPRRGVRNAGRFGSTAGGRTPSPGRTRFSA